MPRDKGGTWDDGRDVHHNVVHLLEALECYLGLRLFEEIDIDDVDIILPSKLPDRKSLAALTNSIEHITLFQASFSITLTLFLGDICKHRNDSLNLHRQVNYKIHEQNSRSRLQDFSRDFSAMARRVPTLISDCSSLFLPLTKNVAESAIIE